MVHNGGRQHDHYPPPSKHARRVVRRAEVAVATWTDESQPEVTRQALWRYCPLGRRSCKIIQRWRGG